MLRTFLLVFGPIATATLALAAYWQIDLWVGLSGVAYAVATIWKALLDVHARRANDQERQRLQAEVTELNAMHSNYHLRSLLEQMNEHHWPNTKGIRSTILLPNTQHTALSPEVRYFYGQPNSECESEAVFQKEMGLIGVAWDEIEPHSATFPDFDSREEFFSYYSDKFNMPKDFASCLSDHMMKVRSILCVGLVDRNKHFRGVLSIDSTQRDTFDDIATLSSLKKNVELIAQQLELRKG